MIEVRQVQFPEIAAHFTSGANLAWRLRRIQRFFADFFLEDLWLAHLIMNGAARAVVTGWKAHPLLRPEFC